MKSDNNAHFKKHLITGDKRLINTNDYNNILTNEEIIMKDNEFDDSRYIQNDKLNETKFPQISTNPFMGNPMLQDGNSELQKSITN